MHWAVVVIIALYSLRFFFNSADGPTAETKIIATVAPYFFFALLVLAAHKRWFWIFKISSLIWVCIVLLTLGGFAIGFLNSTKLFFLITFSAYMSLGCGLNNGAIA